MARLLWPGSTRHLLPVEMLSGGAIVIFHFDQCTSYYGPKLGVIKQPSIIMGQEFRQNTVRKVCHWCL